MKLKKYWSILFLLLCFGLSVQSQSISKFDSDYQKALMLVKYQKESAKEIHQKLSKNYVNPSALQKSKLHYLMLRLYSKKVVFDSTNLIVKRKLRNTSVNDTITRAKLLLQLGEIYDSKEQSHLGIPYILEATELFQKMGMQHEVNSCKIGLSESYRIQDRPDDGIALLKEVLQDKNIRLKDQAHAYNRLATLYNNTSTSPDSTIKYSKKCIIIAEKEKLLKLLALSQNELGHVYNLRLGKQQLAESYFQKAIDNFTLVDEHRNIINTSINYSNVHILKEENTKALVIMNKAVEHLLVNYPSRNSRRLFLHLSKIHKLLGNYKEALEFLDLANLMERLIYFNKVDAKLFEMSAKYNAEAKEKQLKNQQEKNTLLKQRNKLLWIAFILLLVSMLIVVYFFNIKRKYNHQKRLLAERENRDLQHELEIKNKKLAINTLHLLKQTEFDNDFVKALKEIAKSSDATNKKKLLRLVQNKKLNTTSSIWTEFEKSFIEVNISFYTNLNNSFPNLTPNDKRLCAFMKLNMNTKDIASLINISPRGVESARYRLRKKMQLEHDANLSKFLENF